MYSKVHLLFSQAVPEDHLMILAPEHVAQRIETVVEIHLEFSPIDSNAFVLSSLSFGDTGKWFQNYLE